MTQGSQRMEIMLERMEGSDWKTVDPGLVLAQGDRVRFRFRTNFDGYLYVMNHSTSGRYEQLFPREETGTDNRITAGKEYSVPATRTLFRISGPAGYEVVYWMVTPAKLGEGGQPVHTPLPPPPEPGKAPLNLTPRCDDALLKARGNCIDSSAGPKIPRGGNIPPNLKSAAGQQNPRELTVMRQKDTSVIASPAPLAGPVIYEFRLAHR
jgi:hypothetical protein